MDLFNLFLSRSFLRSPTIVLIYNIFHKNATFESTEMEWRKWPKCSAQYLQPSSYFTFRIYAAISYLFFINSWWIFLEVAVYPFINIMRDATPRPPRIRSIHSITENFFSSKLPHSLTIGKNRLGWSEKKNHKKNSTVISDGLINVWVSANYSLQQFHLNTPTKFLSPFRLEK